MFVTGGLLLVPVAVSLDEDMLPENEDDATEVMVANVLPSKSEGTVGLGPTSIRLRPEPDNVMTETDSVAVPISVPALVSSPLL
jgi:hypothetical protein